jgi:hypothetical protein
MLTGGRHSFFRLLLVIGLAFFLSRGAAPLAAQVTALKLTVLRTEYKENPIGIDVRKPHFSWQLQAGGRGMMQAAYLLLNREQYPSWLYPVKQGATTIWERWDGLKPDGTFQDKGMNSFNHYAYGAIGEWMYRVMVGIEIDQAAPGYKHTLIQPQPGGGFTSVKASHQTMYGKVSSAWTLKDGKMVCWSDWPHFQPELCTEKQA